MPRNIVGAPVSGDDCFGRAGLLADMEQRLEVANLLLSAPRRWGKTSVLRVLRDRDPERRHYFDLYPVERASHFVAEVAATTAGPLTRVRQSVGDFLGRTFDRVKEIRVSEVAVELRDRLSQQPSWRDS